jgi:hypothetical protein
MQEGVEDFCEQKKFVCFLSNCEIGSKLLTLFVAGQFAHLAAVDAFFEWLDGTEKACVNFEIWGVFCDV